jgi:uncharacterized protein with gpF-like domain
MKKIQTLRPVHPNAGIEDAYAKKLEALTDAMHRSIMWWVVEAYKRKPPQTESMQMAMDDSTAVQLDKIIKKLTRYWHRKYADAAKELAQYFAQKTNNQTDQTLEHILKASGVMVKFKITPAMNDVLQSTIRQNVALITNMADQHLKEIQGITMRSVQMGGDLKYMSEQLEAKYKMTRKRARLIARDQNSKATAAITRVRQSELGIKQAQWLHSHAGREPRPTHVALNNKLYDVEKGAWDKDADGKGKGRYVYPGELINCRCVSKSVIPALGIR